MLLVTIIHNAVNSVTLNMLCLLKTDGRAPESQSVIRLARIKSLPKYRS